MFLTSGWTRELIIRQIWNSWGTKWQVSYYWVYHVYRWLEDRSFLLTDQYYYLILFGSGGESCSTSHFTTFASAIVMWEIIFYFYWWVQLRCRGAGMAQWWELLPPSNVSRVRFPARCHMWVEFVVGSLLCSERFSSVYSGLIPSPQKPTFPNSNSV